MTAARLASEAEVSPALISQVERGTSDPSLDSLRRIARALGVPLFDLFDDRTEDVAHVVRRSERMVIAAPGRGIAYERISAGGSRVEVLEGVLPPGTASSDEPWAHPPSDEVVLVLEGELVVEVEGEGTLLAEGDGISFSSARPHRYRNDGDAPVRFLLTVTPPSH